MKYDTTKRNYNWNNFTDASDHFHYRVGNKEGSFKIMHNTIARSYHNTVEIQLHATDVYRIEKRHDVGDEFAHSVITLDSGGYQTVTTKDRMNRFLPLGYRVYQKDFDWYLHTPEGTREYQDGMQIKLELA